jgi:selenocysteine lyase/cysteine desulfurase
MMITRLPPVRNATLVEASRRRTHDRHPLRAADREPRIGLRLPDQARDRIIAALKQANCHAAPRGTSLRVSPHLHTTRADIDRLIDTLAGAL